jgi:hypothetical protein
MGKGIDGSAARQMKEKNAAQITAGIDADRPERRCAHGVYGMPNRPDE